jgi:hypothetical protein
MKHGNSEIGYKILIYSSIFIKMSKKYFDEDSRQFFFAKITQNRDDMDVVSSSDSEYLGDITTTEEIFSDKEEIKKND